jgi:hypothetical protein
LGVLQAAEPIVTLTVPVVLKVVDRIAVGEKQLDQKVIRQMVAEGIGRRGQSDRAGDKRVLIPEADT